MKHECSWKFYMKREEIERLCCLNVLGELAPEELSRMKAHLAGCAECETVAREFKRMMLFDLPGLAIARMGEAVSEQALQIDQDELLAGIREKAHTIALKSGAAVAPPMSQYPEAPGSNTRRLLTYSPRLSYAAGWAAAALLFLGYFAISWRTRIESGNTSSSVSATKPLTADLSKPQQDYVEREIELRAALSRAEQRVRDSHTANTQLNLQLQNLSTENDTLRSELGVEKAKVAEESAQLDLNRQSLTEQIAAKENLQNQLADINERMEKRNAELASLSRAAAVVPVSYPVTEQAIGVGEAKEILGARDLHIVDVYDVDGSGRSARAYGRIYYVNHNQLIFYAFDLGKLERDRKVVAFQAWGFRQPQSTQVESLGLFYLDNAPLNRWTLRVSDPRILARIDTLFVTAEPPGGSRFPKGKRLLMASLAGPPNHP